MSAIRISFTEADTRDLVFNQLARWRAGIADRPSLHAVFDEIGLADGELAPAWVRRIYFDAVTGRAVETAAEFLGRIGAPAPAGHGPTSTATLNAAERGHQAIADPSDDRVDAVQRAQAKAARRYWASVTSGARA